MTDDRTAWAAYRALEHLVDARVARDLERQSGISMADYDVLEAVCEMAASEMCVRVTGLGTRMGWAPSRLARQLGRMERRGLIAREPCELDGRGDDVLVTDAGKDVYEQAEDVHRRSVRTHFTGPLSRAQLAALVDISTAIETTSKE